MVGRAVRLKSDPPGIMARAAPWFSRGHSCTDMSTREAVAPTGSPPACSVDLDVCWVEEGLVCRGELWDLARAVRR